MSIKILSNSRIFRNGSMGGSRFNTAPASTVDTKVAVRPEPREQKKSIGDRFKSWWGGASDKVKSIFKKDKPQSIDTTNAPKVSQEQRNEHKNKAIETASIPSKIGNAFKGAFNFAKNNIKTVAGAGLGFLAGGLIGQPLIGAGLGGAISYNLQRPKDKNQLTTGGAVLGAIGVGAYGLLAGATGGASLAATGLVLGAGAGAIAGAATVPFAFDALDAVKGGARGIGSSVSNFKDKNNRSQTVKPKVQEGVVPVDTLSGTKANNPTQIQDPAETTLDVESTEVNEGETASGSTPNPNQAEQPVATAPEVVTTREIVAEPLKTEYEFTKAIRKFEIDGKEVEIVTASRAELQDDRFADALIAKWGQEKYKNYWNQIGQLQIILEVFKESANQKNNGDIELESKIRKLSANLLNGYFQDKGGQTCEEYRAIRKALDIGNIGDVEAQLDAYKGKINLDFKYDEVSAEIKAEFEASNQGAVTQEEIQSDSTEQVTKPLNLPKLDTSIDESKQSIAIETNRFLFQNFNKKDDDFGLILNETASQLQDRVITNELDLNKDLEHRESVSKLHGFLVANSTKSYALEAREILKNNAQNIDVDKILETVAESTYLSLDKKTALKDENFAKNFANMINNSYKNAIISNNEFDFDQFKAQLQAYNISDIEIEKVIKIQKEKIKPLVEVSHEKFNQATTDESKKSINDVFINDLQQITNEIFDLIYINPNPQQQA